MRGILIAAALALLLAIPASATPEDPFADDYVALAYSPTEGVGGWGTSGTEDGAQSIAMDHCQHAGGTACMFAGSNEYGCVAYVTNPATGHWTGGSGPDPVAAVADAYAHIDGGNVGATHCSTPMTPP